MARAWLLLSSASVLLLHAAVLPAPANADASCCEKKRLAALAAALPPFISDPSEQPPAKWLGQPAQVPDPDPAAAMPDDWSEEDDGPWSVVMIPNTAYAWQPSQIPNPAYVPPPSLAGKVAEAVLEAVPWVMIGVVVTALLEAAQLPLEQLRAQLGGSRRREFCHSAAPPLYLY